MTKFCPVAVGAKARVVKSTGGSSEKNQRKERRKKCLYCWSVNLRPPFPPSCSHEMSRRLYMALYPLYCTVGRKRRGAQLIFPSLLFSLHFFLCQKITSISESPSSLPMYHRRKTKRERSATILLHRRNEPPVVPL